MVVGPMTDHVVHLRGVDHVVYGELALVSAGPIVAAMSVGADEGSPSLRFKGDVPNEDALSGRDSGQFARLIVADAHFGRSASEMLVDAVHLAPYDVADPPLFIPEAVLDESATSFTSVWLDREVRQAEVHWFGDSLAVRLRRGHGATLLTDDDHRFVTPSTFDWDEAKHSVVALEAGDVLVAFTDGVNECHYRQPATSITLDHVYDLFDRAGTLTEFVQTLGDLALEGVDGNPGGQDNIAIVAVTA